jgi:hypothetical protein
MELSRILINRYLLGMELSRILMNRWSSAGFCRGGAQQDFAGMELSRIFMNRYFLLINECPAA